MFAGQQPVGLRSSCPQGGSTHIQVIPLHPCPLDFPQLTSPRNILGGPERERERETEREKEKERKREREKERERERERDASSNSDVTFGTLTLTVVT